MRTTDAGIGQGLDLLDRVESGDEAGAISVRDYLRRALVQVSAAAEASSDGRLGVTPSLNEALLSIDSAVAALDEGESIDGHVQSARESLLGARADL